MPGRVSARGARSSTKSVGRKSSTQTLKSRGGSTSTRTSAYAVEIPDEGETTSLRTQICNVFSDAQKSTATHRKLVITLRKIQEACCYEPPNPKKKQQQEEFGEEEFNEEIGRCVLRVLTVKKSEPVGDRIVRFLGLFLQHASEKDNTINQPEDADDTGAFPETPSSRLTSHILNIVLQLFTSKDKVVRFRSTQIIAHIVNTLDSIDDELFQLVRLGLLKRLRDKEAPVRVQAVLGLGRLADPNEDENEEDSDDEAGGIFERLLDVMQNDPSADVRRNLLLNLPFTPSTLPYLLERARDLDPATRRQLYSRLLPALGDFRHLSVTHREKLLRWGLRDRDEHVRKATARLFRERWIEDCARTANANNEDGEKSTDQAAVPSYDALLELLERIDVINSGVEDGIALEAIREFWDGRPDYREFITFDDDFWNDLTPESAFIARSFNDYCRDTQDNSLQDMVEDKMPEVTKFAFFVQKHLNVLIEYTRKVALEEDGNAEDEEGNTDLEQETLQQEFCVEQLLHIALTLDYTDEVGRRQMFSIMREALALAELPEECTKLVVEVLRTVCGSREAGEREFVTVVLEAIAEVRDTIIGEDASEAENVDDSFHSARSELSDDIPASKQKKSKAASQDPEADEEKAIREIMVNMKCLHVAQCMLQNVHTDIEQNSALTLMLNTLIVPAVRSQEAPIRERGLACLGLCCLLSKNLASENLTLFLHCFARGNEGMQSAAIQIIADMLIIHPSLLTPPIPDPSTADASETEPAPTVHPMLKPLTKTFIKALSASTDSIALMSCVAASKLLLLNLLPAPSNSDILKAFTLAYFNPETASNPALRQALSYFLPVFCHSQLRNAVHMSQITVGIISKLLLMREELEEEEGEMVGWSTIAGMLAEWTDGRKVVGGELGVNGGIGAFVEGSEEPHVVLATEILERALSNSCSKDERKPLLTLLSKLHISASAPQQTLGSHGENHPHEESFRTLHALASEAVESKIGLDATSRNMLLKLENSLNKRLGEVEHVVQTTELPDSTEVSAEGPVDGAKIVGTLDEDDTLLANVQAEGTRFPLEDEDEAEDETIVKEEISLSTVQEVSETDSVVDRLLESEIEE